MTKRLYMEDPYVTAFDADVVGTRETDDGPAVVFAETYFYPESGGQPFDLGTIDGAPITKVIETDDDTVLHVVERLPRASRVHCEIDETRRRDHMQQHSGQHILSAAFVEEVDANTTSFHLGAAVSTIDLDRWPLTDDDVARAERAANDVARRGVAIRTRVVTGDEARALDLRKPPPGGESIRLVEVDGFDNQACCGTHPRSTSEVSPIAVRAFEKFKDGTRVEFVCGDRALADYHETVSRVRSLASVLSSSEAELVDTATKLQAERKAMGKELGKLKRRALLADAESWMDKAEELAGRLVLVEHVDDLGPGELRTVAQKLVEKPGRVILLGSVAGGRAHLVFARSRDVDADMNAMLRSAAEAVAGRGGGTPEIAQGGGPDVEGVPQALATARKLLVP
jgi:alanyl-tRNA synthetase